MAKMQNCVEDQADDDLTLDIDLEFDAKLADFPSPDGSRSFTTIADLLDTVICTQPENIVLQNVDHIESSDVSRNINCTTIIDPGEFEIPSCFNTGEIITCNSQTEIGATNATSSSNQYEQIIVVSSSNLTNPKPRTVREFSTHSIDTEIDEDQNNVSVKLLQSHLHKGHSSIVSFDTDMQLSQIINEKTNDDDIAYNSEIPTTVEAVESKDRSVYRRIVKPKPIPVPKNLSASPKPIVITRKKPQRKRKESSKERQKILWQFLIEILHNKSHNPSIITWVDFTSGIFKIMQSDTLAKLWGSYRNKETGIKYEFFARAMRHYYRQDIIRRVPGKKLTYQFGDKINWKTAVRNTGIQRRQRDKPKGEKQL